MASFGTSYLDFVKFTSPYSISSNFQKPVAVRKVDINDQTVNIEKNILEEIAMVRAAREEEKMLRDSRLQAQEVQKQAAFEKANAERMRIESEKKAAVEKANAERKLAVEKAAAERLKVEMMLKQQEEDRLRLEKQQALEREALLKQQADLKRQMEEADRILKENAEIDSMSKEQKETAAKNKLLQEEFTSVTGCSDFNVVSAFLNYFDHNIDRAVNSFFENEGDASKLKPKAGLAPSSNVPPRSASPNPIPNSSPVSASSSADLCHINIILPSGESTSIDVPLSEPIFRVKQFVQSKGKSWSFAPFTIIRENPRAVFLESQMNLSLKQLGFGNSVSLECKLGVYFS